MFRASVYLLAVCLALPVFGQCDFPEWAEHSPVELIGPAPSIRGTDVINACFDEIGPYSFYGRSVAVGEFAPDGFHVALRTLDRYEPYAFIPAQQSLLFQHSADGDISGFAVFERVLGSDPVEGLMPQLLSDLHDPLAVLLSEQGGYFKLSTLADTIVAGPFFLSEYGVLGSPVHAAIDNDNFRAYLLLDMLEGPGVDWALAGLRLPTETDIPLPQLEIPPVPMAPLLGTRNVLDMDFIEGQETLVLLLDSPREVLHIDLHNPSLPLLGPSCLMDLNTHGLAVSDGYCDLDGGIGQWVSVRDDTGIPFVCVTPCAPSPLPMPYPVLGTYLEPQTGFSIAADESESLSDTIEIYPWIDGPWWPEQITGFFSFNGFVFISFDTDTSGMADPEITYGDANEGGDGWRLQYAPTNDDELPTTLRLCYEIELNGTLIYIQRDVNIQDAFKPDIQTPAQDGQPVQEGGPGVIEQPDPDDVDESKVERREVTNPASEDVEPIPQVRVGLPKWKYKVVDENGEEQEICIEGGAHCAPTATIQQIIALAGLNECLNRKLNCYLGYGDVISNFWSDDDLTKLIKLMGVHLRTNKGECGSRYEYTCEGLKKFIEFICANGEAQCDIVCNPHIYCHFVACGADGENLDWDDIQTEFEEKKQTISLKLQKNGQKMTHRVSIVSITIRPDGKVEIEVADPAYPDDTYTIVIDPSTKPPTIIDDGNADEEWNKITGAIAISDTTPVDDGDIRDRAHSLDQEFFTWETVAQQSGAVTNFTYENLTPGFWKYRVRNYTFGGDSATAYKTVYVPDSLNLTAIRENNDLVLRWETEPWAIEYIVQHSAAPAGPWQDMTTTTGTTLTTSYDSLNVKHYRVISVFGP